MVYCSIYHVTFRLRDTIVMDGGNMAMVFKMSDLYFETDNTD